MNNKTISIPTVSPVEFQRHLRYRPLEDVRLIATLEAFLKRNRGYVFRLPPEGSNVILLFSGGVDSTVAWYTLAHIYKFHVYPFFVKPRGPCPQQQSVVFFSRFYQRLFGRRYHRPFVVPHNFLPQEMEENIQTDKLSAETLLGMYNSKKHMLEVKSMSGLSGMAAQLGVLYSAYLMIKHQITAETIFCAVTCKDGMGIGSQTLTSLRSTLVYLVRFHAMPRLQYASVFFEKETGWFAAKRDIIAIGAAAGLPLEKTYSCYTGANIHCGECPGCVARRYEFKRAGVPDRTVYRSKGTDRGVANFHPMSIMREYLRRAI